MNSFDGALTILGILIATYFAQLFDPKIIIVASLGVIVSTGVSGVWGGYMAERAEKKRAKRELEKHLMRSLSKTRLEKEMKKVAVFMGLANGLSSSIVSFIAIIPFFFAALGLLQISLAFIISFIIILISLFSLGIFIGKIAEENMFFHGLMMVVVGIVVGVILYLFELVKII